MLTETGTGRLHLIWSNTITGERYEYVHGLPISIGRASSLNTIVLDNKQVSRQHAWLKNDAGQIVIIDRDSTNGTFIKGQRIRRAALNSGDSFRIGPFDFICADSQSADHTVQPNDPARLI